MFICKVSKKEENEKNVKSEIEDYGSLSFQFIPAWIKV